MAPLATTAACMRIAPAVPSPTLRYGETQSRSFIASLAAITSHSLHHCFLLAKYVAGGASLLAWKTLRGFRTFVVGLVHFVVGIGGGRFCFALEDPIFCVFFPFL
jgi:hypothetical protein